MRNKIIIDVDDTLWNLNERICTKHDIPMIEFKSYRPETNSAFTREQIDILYKEYANAKMYEDMGLPCNLGKLNKLTTKGFDVYINSFCFSQDITDLKYEQLSKILNIPKENYIFRILSNDVTVTKDIDETVIFFMDDSPHNIAKSKAKANIVVRKPWNVSDAGKDIIQNKPVLYFNTGMEAIDFVVDCLL